MMQDTCLYASPLDASKRQIRLLEILSINDRIECRLHTETLNDDLRYVALSYVWGDPKKTIDIIVDGVETPVTTNLAEALKYVQNFWQYEYPTQSLTSFRIWVDALSINQLNSFERAEQVKLMPKIYSSADLVLAWLGSENPAMLVLAISTLAILTSAFQKAEWDIEKLCEMKWIVEYPSLIRPPECDERWKSIDFLARLPYWKRVWILQENTLASKLFYISPHAMIEQSSLASVCAMIDVIRVEIERRKTSRPIFIPSNVWLVFNAPKHTTFVSWQSFTWFGSAKSLVSSYGPEKSVEDNLQTSLILSQFGGKFQATEPKDHIYGLLGLDLLKINIDYSNRKSVKEVYIEYCHTVMEFIKHLNNRNVFFLLDGGIGVFENKLNFPSWVPNYPERARGEPSLAFDGKANLSSLVPTIPHPEIEGSILSLSGVTLGRVKRLGGQPLWKNFRDGELKAWCQNFITRQPRYPTNTMPSVWALFATAMRLQEVEHDTPTMLMLICFTLSLDFKIPATSHNHLEFIQTPEIDGFSVTVVDSGNNNPDMRINVAVGATLELEEPGQSMNERLSEVEYRMSVALNRNVNTKLFETDEGYFGMGPKFTAEDDIICMVDGYADLVLLRKCGNYYQYIGPCTAPGLPDKASKENLEKGNIEVKLFHII
ncbi:HET-domain-containing protein [Xylariaceae sp. FL0255]|nr:HET-domain-containing protein [Xylariaceae sp. FL0255]